ncbi:hypothetical protein [Streptomyces sp. NPDC057682]
MARLVPLLLIGLGLYFWFKARKRASAYVASMESDEAGPGR